MSIICEDIKNNAIIDKVNYIHTKDFVKAYPSPAPLTPLGANWKFQPTVLASNYKLIGQQIFDIDVRSDDLFVVTYAKAGTTWTQTMVWLLQNNLDYELEKESNLTERFPFMEYASIFNLVDTSFDSINRINKLPSPRNIKTHLPAGLLPKQVWTVKPKIIYVARNPKDVAISFYYHYRNMHGYLGTFMDFMNAFLSDLVIFEPFHQHVIEFWKMRNEENILFLTYEDMQTDLLAVIKRTAKFLGKSYTDDELIKLRNHLTVDSMRSNDASNNEYLIAQLHETMGFKLLDSEFKFIRKGKSGSFLDEMTPELIERFNTWSQNKLKDTDFKFSM